MSCFLLDRNLKLLEPYDWKLSRTVLRGEGGSNAPDLPGIKRFDGGYRCKQDYLTGSEIPVQGLSSLEVLSMTRRHYERTGHNCPLFLCQCPVVRLFDGWILCARLTGELVLSYSYLLLFLPYVFCIHCL